MNRPAVGVCIVGCNGAVATTVMAGIELMKKGLVPREGMITEGRLNQAVAAICERVQFVAAGLPLELKGRAC